MAVDHDRLDELMGKVIDELGAALGIGMMLIGERAGPWAALSGAGPLTSRELAARSGADERYVREWLRGMAAAGYVDYAPGDDRYAITEEVAFAMADPDGPSVPGACQVVLAALQGAPAVAEHFAAGEGIGWHEHTHDLFEGTGRFFRPRYATHLVSEWIPALEGVEEALRAGALVAEVGCGHGASTILMAEAFPTLTFAGFDHHEPSIARAREMTHEVRDTVLGDGRLAFATHCRYPDGTRVLCSTIADLNASGRITRQTIVQAWDE